MVVLEKKPESVLYRTIVDNGKVIAQCLIDDALVSEFDISIMYRLCFNTNFNNSYSRNPDLNVAKYLENMGYGEIVSDTSKFMPPDIVRIE